MSPLASMSASTAWRPTSFHGGKRVEDRAPSLSVVTDIEEDAGAVDRGRLDTDAEALRLPAKLGELVGIVEVEGHRPRQKLDRVIGLEIGRLECDERVGCSVALVEAVIGELGEEVEDLVGLALVQPTLDGALHEPLALGVHLRLDLLAHGAPQEVGIAERIAGKELCDLHHLFLVDDDAKRLLQDRFELRMRIPGLRRVRVAPELACAIDRDIRHRARAVERDERNQVLEAVGLHLDERLAHSGAFHLEHADGFATAQGLVGIRVVERQRGQVDLDAFAGDEIDGRAQHGQRLEAEKIELHQAGLLDPLHVELGHAHAGLRIAVERHELFERPVADDDAGRVRRSVAMQPLEFLGDVEHARDDGLLDHCRLQLRLAFDRLLQCHRVRRILRHELRELVDVPVRHFEHAADVAHHSARLQRAEGDDLRDLLFAVALLHVFDDALAPVDAEVDVEVGHRDAFGIEEALEQQAEPDRIEIRHRQRVGDKRSGAGPAARPDRNIMVLRPFDEVGDDEEVAGKLHSPNDADLVGETVVVVLFGEPRRRAVRGEPAGKALLGLAVEFLAFIERRLRIEPETRQDGLARRDPVGAAHRDLDAGIERVGKIGEELHHLPPRLEIMLGRQPAAVLVGDDPAIRDGEKRIVRLVVAGLGEEGLVRRDDGQTVAVGERDQLGLDRALVVEPMTLDFDVEVVSESLLHRLDARARKVLPAAGAQRQVEWPGWAARQGDQALPVRRQQRRCNLRRVT